MNPHLREQILAYDSDRPLEQARTIPANWYRDADMAQLEQTALFARSWQMVGRAALVEKPGCFLTATIAGEPILVVRDTDQSLRGFFNVCRHRAAPLLTQPCGQVSRLRCRYHGWTYGPGWATARDSGV